MGYKQKKGFTLIELVMTVAILGIISVGGAFMLTFMVQSAVFIPNKLNMDMLACDALDIMIEGDEQAKGLRYSRSVTDIQPFEITFVNQDNLTVRYILNTADNKLYRSIGGGAEATIPYYASAGGVSLIGKSGRMFSYYDNIEAVTGNPADVRRIEIAVIAMTGSGDFDQWQGQADLSSAISVHRF